MATPDTKSEQRTARTPYRVRAVVTCGSGDAVVLADRVADAAQRVTGLKRDVVGDPPDGADQGEQFGDAVACSGGGMLGPLWI
jgi:hypothetical protein